MLGTCRPQGPISTPPFLKARWGKDTTTIKAMLQAELDEARRLLDEAVKDRSRLEIRVASNDDILEELRQR